MPLVEGSDLTVRDRQLFLKTLQGLERVHGVLRRLDDEWLDPLELRPTPRSACRACCRRCAPARWWWPTRPAPASSRARAWPLSGPASPPAARRGAAAAGVDPWWCGEDSVWQAQRARLAEFVVAADLPGQRHHARLRAGRRRRPRPDAARGVECAHRCRPGGLHAAGSRAAVADADVGWRAIDLRRCRVARLRVRRRPRRLACAARRHGARGRRARERGLDPWLSMQHGSASADLWVMTRGDGRSHLAAAHRRCRPPTCRTSSAR